jgi:hypothetical protein
MWVTGWNFPLTNPYVQGIELFKPYLNGSRGG